MLYLTFSKDGKFLQHVHGQFTNYALCHPSAPSSSQLGLVCFCWVRWRGYGRWRRSGPRSVWDLGRFQDRVMLGIDYFSAYQLYIHGWQQLCAVSCDFLSKSCVLKASGFPVQWIQSAWPEKLPPLCLQPSWTILIFLVRCINGPVGVGRCRSPRPPHGTGRPVAPGTDPGARPRGSTQVGPRLVLVLRILKAWELLGMDIQYSWFIYMQHMLCMVYIYIYVYIYICICIVYLVYITGTR